MANIDRVKEYFRRIDQGEFPAEIFTADFEFFFPKFGVGRGVAEFYELAGGMAAAEMRVQHHHDRFTFIEAGDQIVVEGTTYGTERNGAWTGGETPGGRFCSTFDFSKDGLISRMYVYLDPDYAGVDTPRFRWQRQQPRW